MHEVGIMQEMARMAVERAEAADATRIHVIRLRVGRMAAVVPEAMQFAHEVVTGGTIAEGSKLEIEEVPVVCWCGQCEEEFESGESLFLCPRCDGFSREVRSGRELELLSMEVS